jgi:hypothetical protein
MQVGVLYTPPPALNKSSAAASRPARRTTGTEQRVNGPPPVTYR